MRTLARPTRATARLVALVSLTAASLAVVVARGAPAQAETVDLQGASSITVVGNGNGHGHGMSQYGAQGAALQGKTAAQIVGFYYPHTTLATISGTTTMRVLISEATAQTCVAAQAGLTVTGVATGLPTSGVSRYRLAPSGPANLVLQKSAGSSCSSGTWTTVGPARPGSADFGNASGHVRLYLSDGTSTDYRGTVGAVRSGTGEITVNRVGLDNYAAGVTPRESPATWQPAAVQAQAIAARTYGEYEREHASGAYDICDTDQCQVYGGMTHYDASGNVLWQDDPAAVTPDAGQIVEYGGAAAFTQFSASDGGWTVDGGQPYLVAQADPYDDAASGDPYLGWTHSVSVQAIASYYGLSSVTQIAITQRDGHGAWGGRVLAAVITGLSGGAATQVSTTGFDLQDALGVPQNWFMIVAPPPPNSLGATTVDPSSTTADVFYRSSTNHLTQLRYVTGSGWAAPADLGAPSSGALTWDPDASTWGSGHMDVAARDSTGHLVLDSYTVGPGWSGWRTYPEVIGSSPAVTSPSVNETDVFYLAANHQLGWLRWTQAAGWRAPQTIAGPANVASGPDAMSVAATKSMTVAYRGTDGRLWTTTWTGAAWSTPSAANLGHPMPVPTQAVDPSVDNAGSSLISLYYTGTDGLIYHCAYNPATNLWTTWMTVPADTGNTSAPDVYSSTTSHTDVVSGHNGAIGTQSWAAQPGWRVWLATP